MNTDISSAPSRNLYQVRVEPFEDFSLPFKEFISSLEEEAKKQGLFATSDIGLNGINHKNSRYFFFKDRKSGLEFCDYASERAHELNSKAMEGDYSVGGVWFKETSLN